MKAYVIVDLGFGDAGKGTIVDYLSRLTPNTVIVRYNGGPQAGHNVVTADGRHHTFSQFGSGTLVPSVKTYLSKFMWVEPLALLREDEGLKKIGITDGLSRLYIDEHARIITPFHKVINRMKETINNHGSCGVGMGEAVSDSINGLSLTIGECKDRHTAMRKLKEIQADKIRLARLVEGSGVWKGYEEDMQMLIDPEAPDLCFTIYNYLLNRVNVVRAMGTGADQIIFEGACGVMLDENYGFHPHTMWATTTTENVKEIYKGEVKTLGLIRTYSTRHGNGPFVSEQSFKFDEPHNITSKWQGGFRFGALDIVATKYAMAVTGDVDSLVVTHTDRYYPYLCVGYDGIGKPFYKRNQLIPPTKGDLARQGQLTKALAKATPRLVTWDEVEEIGERLGKPIAIISFGARADQKKVCSL